MLPLCFHRFPVSLVLRAALFGEIRYIDLLICQLPTGQSTKIENPYGRCFFIPDGCVRMGKSKNCAWGCDFFTGNSWGNQWILSE